MPFGRRRGGYGRDLLCLALLAFLCGATRRAGADSYREEASRLEAEALELRDAGRFDAAIDVARRLLTMTEKARGEDDAEVAAVLCFLAQLQETVGEDEQAATLYERALRIREKEDPQAPEVATVANDLARLCARRAEYARAEELYERALAVRKSTLGAKDPAVAVVLSNLAALYYDRADYARAESLYQEAVAIELEALGAQHPDVASTLNNLALLYQKQGEHRRAEELYQRALAIYQSADGRQEKAVANVLNSLASLRESRGEYASAQRLFRRALAIDESEPGREGLDVSSVLNNLASLYQSLGDYRAAEPLYRRSLEIRQRALGDRHPEVAASYNNLGMLYEAEGEYARAESLYQQALSIYEEVLGKEHPDSEAVRGNIAGLFLEQGKLEAAHPILANGGWPSGLGRYYLEKRDYRKAYVQFFQAAQAAEKRGQSRHLLSAQIGLGLALEGMFHADEAFKHYRAAVELIEEQRAALGGAERTHFLGGALGAGLRRVLAYEGLVRTSVKLGRMSDALRWSEYTKARRLLEVTAHKQVAPGLPARVAEEEERRVARLDALYRQREAAFARNPALFARIDGEELPAARRRLDDFVRDLRRRYPAYAAFKYPQPMGVDQIVLEPHEVLLEYAVTEEETYAWLLRGHTVVKFTAIPLGRAALDREVREYRSLFEGIEDLADLRSDTSQGRRLFELLVEDSLSDCRASDNLIIVPDGSLGLIPFEALVVDGTESSWARTDAHYLGEVFSIQYAQSATVLSNARAIGAKPVRQMREKVLVLADPVFSASDERWQGARRGGDGAPGDFAAQQMEAVAEDMRGTPILPRLAKTVELANGLQERFGTKSVESLSGIGASEASLRNKALADYRYLVFATHGVLSGQVRYLQEPALVLSQVGVDGADPRNDGYLTLSDVMGLQLDADVAALTACESGVGKELGGEGVMGMGWAFEYAGARNVVMSLWSVEQSASVKLMESFFAQLRKGVTPQQALRVARAEIREAGYRHPFFWAPFILVGGGAGPTA